MDFSIVIPTLNRSEDLKVTLQSILEQSLLPKEVIIVDQSDNEEARLLINRISADTDIKFIYRWISEKSLTKARNIGVNLANYELTTFLDDDVKLDKDYLREVREVFKKRDAILVGGKITNPGYDKSLKKVLLGTYSKLFYLSRIEKDKFDVQASFNPTQCFDFRDLLHMQWASGSNHSVLTEVARETRFDEQLIKYAYQEDIDFTYRIYKKYPDRVYVTPRAKLKHFVTKSSRLPERKKMYMEAVHRRYLFKKNIKQSPKNQVIFYWSRLGKLLLFFILKLLKIEREAYCESVAAVKDILAAELYAFKNRRHIDNGDLRFFHKWLKCSDYSNPQLKANVHS